MVLADIFHRTLKSFDGLGLQNDAASIAGSKGKILWDIQISGAERQMVTATGSVMKMHMSES